MRLLLSANLVDTDIRSCLGTLQDVNGDGLMDAITNTSPLKVKLNTGNGFGPEISWGNLEDISKSSSTSESANVAFTIGFPIPPPPPGCGKTLF